MLYAQVRKDLATKALHFIVLFNSLCAKVEISPDKMEQGSLAVLRVLNHEAIHVAQSCKNGGVNYRVTPLGVDISPRKIYHTQMNSKIYSNASRDIKKAEKEAYSYEYSSQSAIYFINKYCNRK